MPQAYQPEIGIQMFMLRDKLKTPEAYRDTCRRLAEIGYRNIQVTPPSFFSEEEFRVLLAQNGLHADSVMLPFDQIAEKAGSAAHLAQRFGCDVLRTTGIPAELSTSAEGYRAFAASLNRAGAACKNAGLRLVYHFHSWEWAPFGEQRGMDILLGETDPDCVYFQPDVFWMVHAGLEPSDALRLFGGRAFYLHVADYAVPAVRSEKIADYYAPVGRGNLNWKGIFRTAQELGITQLVVEQEFSTGDILDAARENLLGLRRLLAK